MSASTGNAWSFYPFTNTWLIRMRITAANRSAHEWAVGLVASPVGPVDGFSTLPPFPTFVVGF